MRTTVRSLIALPACALFAGLLLATAAPRAAAQGYVSLAPTFQGSVAAYEGGPVDPVLGPQRFHAWGFMAGLERPGRFWQPHLWLQRYELGRPCETGPHALDCTNDGWALSVGPGLRVIDTPYVSGTFLPQVGLGSRNGGVTGGAGLHVGVKVATLRPSGFARYHVVRGVHYGTVGIGLILRIPLPEG